MRVAWTATNPEGSGLLVRVVPLIDRMGLARVIAQERDPRVAAQVGLLGEARMVLTGTHSPSKSHPTTEVCGSGGG